MPELVGYLSDTADELWKDYTDTGLTDAQTGYGLSYGLAYGGNHTYRKSATLWIKDATTADPNLFSINSYTRPGYPFDGSWRRGILPNIYVATQPNYYIIETLDVSSTPVNTALALFKAPDTTGEIADNPWWHEETILMTKSFSVHNTWVEPGPLVPE